MSGYGLFKDGAHLPVFFSCKMPKNTSQRDEESSQGPQLGGIGDSHASAFAKFVPEKWWDMLLY